MNKRVTIADVAQVAGVSMMTISRVVNDSGPVSEATKQRVLKAIEEMGYRPSGLARSLATRRTGTIGLVVPDISNPFFAGVAKGVEQVAYAERYSVFLGNTSEDWDRELAILQSLEEKRVDGLILCSSRLQDERLREALHWHPHTVLVNRQFQGFGSVLMDDRAGAVMLVEHLLNSGRQRIGVLAGPLRSISGQKRLQGYRLAMQRAGRTWHDGWVKTCAPSVEGGLDAAIALLTAHPELDALLCYNDLVAVGALQAAANLGQVVPDDIAITGFDDIPLSALVTPSLTTCHVPVQNIGSQAMRLLLDCIGGCAQGCEETMLKPELVIRASTSVQVAI